MRNNEPTNYGDSEHELLKFLEFYIDKYKQLPPDLRNSLINLLVDSESDIIENFNRKDLEDLVWRGSSVIGVGKLSDKEILKLCHDEDIAVRYRGEITFIVEYTFSAIELTKLFKEWMDIKQCLN